ncbi:MAG: 16S rRNA (cytidine(1402)-2'-O)-methyltransferase [Deltaproteobacteria bacterium]|nr:16S rRNA (cytidine(1402)-2'-O)-methyltransferase [Deltaproteobacteria bacterium]
MSGILYIVATPIGNLEDITLRALRILKEVDLIAAEDTRHTKTLLNHYGIHTPLTSYHDHNEKTKAHALVARLEQGENVALVSDAGTPTLSDPGYRLVRESVEAGVNVVPVPGASALTAVLSASGLPTDRFVFEGFLSAKKRERRERLQGLREESRTLVFYEAPHRLKGSLQDLLEVLGDREVVLGREVTKIYEEFIRGRLSEVTALAGSREWRGEITLVVKGSEGRKAPADDLLTAEIQRLRRKGMRVKEIAELLGERFSYPKREVYRLALEREEKSDTIP